MTKCCERPAALSSSSLLLSRLELSDIEVYETSIRDLLGTASQFYEVVVLNPATSKVRSKDVAQLT